MVNYTRCFDLAWERMVTILFRPFDLGKWFVIGFSAFLAGLLSGGNGLNNFNFRQNVKPTDWSYSYHSNIQHFNDTFSNLATVFQGGLAMFLIVVIVFFALGFIILFYWLGSRGQFLLLDNVVRNRGAIRWPWSVYSRQGNSLFGFCLLYFLGLMAVILPLAGVAIVTALPLMREHRFPHAAELGIFVVIGLIYLAITLTFGLMFFLFRELGVPLMFRHGLLARAAFAETWGLVKQHPGAMVLFLLLRLALALALIVLGALTCCCCVGFVPYLGTVALLPGIIYIRCFALEFLAQLGPRYDVWNVDVPLEVAPVATTLPPSAEPPFSPPPPLG